jgi:type IV pilus assembly protein PilV
MLRTPADQSGFTLLEVLIALLIIAVGLLGIAGIQALTINNTGIAMTRSLAAIEASSLAGAMHSNLAYWAKKGTVSTASSVTGTAGASYTNTVLGDATLNANNTDCTTVVCSKVQMASYDLKQWGLAVANQLPGGIGNFTCSVPVGLPVSCVISITWTENNVALNKVGTETGKLASGTQTQQTYTMVVVP